MMQTSLELSQVRDGLVPVLAILDGEWPMPLERLANVGRNRPALLNRAIAATEVIGVFLSGAADRSTYPTVAQRASALMARNLLGNCSGAKQEWLDEPRGRV